MPCFFGEAVDFRFGEVDAFRPLPEIIGDEVGVLAPAGLSEKRTCGCEQCRV